MRPTELQDAEYAVAKLQESYNSARARGLSHDDSITVASKEYDIERFKVASLVRSPEEKARVAAEREARVG